MSIRLNLLYVRTGVEHESLVGWDTGSLQTGPCLPWRPGRRTFAAMRLTWPLISLVLGACTGTTGDDSQTLESTVAEIQSTHCWQTTLAWGDGESELGLIPRGYEVVARGPQALAVAKNGEVFVLDSVNGRVLGVTQNGSRVAVKEVATDAEDLAVGSDGALAVHSPFQSRSWIFDADGAPAGELEISRSLRGLVGISLGDSREVIAHSAYQESFSMGSPAAPKDLPTLLSQKREGAYQLSDGRGVSVRAQAGVAEVLLLRSSAGENARTETSAVLAISGEVTGANLVGVSGDIACLRLEKVEQPGDAIEVSRRSYCLNTTTGAAVVDNPMPAANIYRPRHELAVGGDTPVLASLQPSDHGLTVVACEVLR